MTTTMPFPSRSHEAAGPAAGYLFQPERALYWLARAPSGSHVGIETIDDICVHLSKGTRLEQLKHFTSKVEPFKERSRDLWKTLSIWMELIATKKWNVEECEFYLTTNRAVSAGLAARLGAKTKKAEELDALLAKLKSIGSTLPQSVKPYADKVLAHSDEEIRKLVERVRVDDTIDTSKRGAYMRRTIRYLHLPASIPAEDIYLSLLGWLHEQVLSMWREREPAIISSSQFDAQLHRVVQLHQEIPFSPRPAHELRVDASAIEDSRSRILVSQLQNIDLQDPDAEIVEAITKYLQCASERSRLALAGVLTETDFKKFEDELIALWTNVKRFEVADGKEARRSDQAIGYRILIRTLMHQGRLGNVQLNDGYFTQGWYHTLADRCALGWHPLYKKLFRGEAT